MNGRCGKLISRAAANINKNKNKNKLPTNFAFIKKGRFVNYAL